MASGGWCSTVADVHVIGQLNVEAGGISRVAEIVQAIDDARKQLNELEEMVKASDDEEWSQLCKDEVRAASELHCVPHLE